MRATNTYYDRNREAQLANSIRAYHEGAAKRRADRASSGCRACGERDPYVLHSTKKHGVLCANCHRKVWIDSTPKAPGRGEKARARARNRATLRAMKAERGCAVCQERNPKCLDFHHREAHTKRSDVSALVKSGVRALLLEVEKCDVLCVNCHRREHRRSREFNGTDVEKTESRDVAVILA